MTELAQKLRSAIDRLRRVQVFHTRDDYGDIFVYEQNGKRLLTFDERFEQSTMDIARPYRPEHRYIRAMLLPLAFAPSIDRALHLGLGGGAIIRAIHKLKPSCRHTAVELRPGVKRVCSAYFLDTAALPLRLVLDDAWQFIQHQKPAQFDYISSDLYLADGMAIKQASQAYIEACAQSLTPSGWLALNFTRLPDYRDPLFQCLRRCFSSLIMVSVDTLNYVILAGRQPLVKPLAGFSPQVLALGKQLEVKLLQQLKQARLASDFFHDTE